jgi:hypothetical protein
VKEHKPQPTFGIPMDQPIVGRLGTLTVYPGNVVLGMDVYGAKAGGRLLDKEDHTLPFLINETDELTFDDEPVDAAELVVKVLETENVEVEFVSREDRYGAVTAADFRTIGKAKAEDDEDEEDDDTVLTEEKK